MNLQDETVEVKWDDSKQLLDRVSTVIVEKQLVPFSSQLQTIDDVPVIHSKCA